MDPCSGKMDEGRHRRTWRFRHEESTPLQPLPPVPVASSESSTTARAPRPSLAFVIAVSIILLVQTSMQCSAEPLSSSTEYITAEKTLNSRNKLSTPAVTETSTTKVHPPVTQRPAKVSKRSGSQLDGKPKKTIAAKETQNRSREALSHEGSERDSVIYLSETAGYVPVTSFRGEHPPLTHLSAPGAVSASGSAGYHAGTIDIDTWRPDVWDRDYNKRLRINTTRVQHIEAECQDDYMKIRIGFNGSFAGLLYSAGYAYDPDCMYINGSGRDYYEFYIQLNRCGTLGKNALLEDNRKSPTNFMWNTITVQYNPLIEEEFDEHFKVTCEYGYDFWKTVTFPFLDVEVATGNPVVFTLSPPECYMEIRNGYGVAGTRVTGPVRVGDPLTLIIYMRSKYDGFDIVVNDCYAHNGANKRIQLIDEFGCPEDDKLISRFRGTWSESGVYETQVYAYMKTFRFTGSPALYIECDVRMCHGRCPSQRCHWRNLKSVAKREVTSNQTILEESEDKEKSEVSLSENVNLFQSLRVLQEEDGVEEETAETIRQPTPTETCIRTSVLSALTAGLSITICILSVSLMITCAKLRYRKKENSLYDAYINHKGQID
ncbi:unnamed protein product [Hermetia illucens]|uniref:ZP domain-containing protein n=1 Tax=Hermetia illucens TaxID=343691 RepID=A0A7R8UIV9_HERIL|nr:unnamed protein product [Hermetia illucens]